MYPKMVIILSQVSWFWVRFCFLFVLYFLKCQLLQTALHQLRECWLPAPQPRLSRPPSSAGVACGHSGLAQASVLAPPSTDQLHGSLLSPSARPALQVSRPIAPKTKTFTRQ